MWKRNIPNILSVIRLIMIPIFVIVFLSDIEHKSIISFVVFTLAWCTDVLDGYLARKNQWITEVGKILDPLADKLMQVAALVCLVILERLAIYVIVVVVIKEMMMAIGAFIIVHKKKSVAPSTWVGKLATFLLFVAVSVLILIESPSPLLVDIINISVVVSVLFALLMYGIGFITSIKKSKKE